MNKHYQTKRFEYFDLKMLTIALRDLPDLQVLEEFASQLVTKLEPMCRKAINP